MRGARDAGQRWFKWVNLDTLDCPPFGAIRITGSRIVGTDLVFEATRISGNAVHPWEEGVPWNAAFNDEHAVEPVEDNPDAIGWLTMDLPAWTIISDSVILMSFCTWLAGSSAQRWSLHHVTEVGPVADELQYLPGFRVFATRYMPEWYDTWNARQPGFLQGNYKLGWVGGLATQLNDSLDLTAPGFE